VTHGILSWEVREVDWALPPDGSVQSRSSLNQMSSHGQGGRVTGFWSGGDHAALQPAQPATDAAVVLPGGEVAVRCAPEGRSHPVRLLASCNGAFLKDQEVLADLSHPFYRAPSNQYADLEAVLSSAVVLSHHWNWLSSLPFTPRPLADYPPSLHSTSTPYATQ